MRTLDVAEQFLELRGESLGASEWREVSQSHVDAFAAATTDHQWIHVDPARAAAGPFGTTIAHGMLTLSLVPILVSELVEVRSTSLILNYGFDRVRFVAPVPVGSHVRVAATVADAASVPAGVRVKFSTAVELHETDSPACVADVLLQWNE